MILRKCRQNKLLLGYFFHLTLLLTSLKFGVSANDPNGADCNFDTFRRHLARVCAVYIKRSAEFYMIPLANIAADGSARKSSPKKDYNTAAKLWGYYLRKWKTSQDSTSTPEQDDKEGGYLYQVSPGQEILSLPQAQDSNPFVNNNFHPPLQDEPLLGKDWYEHFGIWNIKVISSNSSPSTTIPKTPDTSFTKRFRRNPMLRSLVVKCCSSSGCTPHDFVAVANEFSVCK